QASLYRLTACRTTLALLARSKLQGNSPCTLSARTCLRCRQREAVSFTVRAAMHDAGAAFATAAHSSVTAGDYGSQPGASAVSVNDTTSSVTSTGSASSACAGHGADGCSDTPNSVANNDQQTSAGSSSRAGAVLRNNRSLAAREPTNI